MVKVRELPKKKRDQRQLNTSEQTKTDIAANFTFGRDFASFFKFGSQNQLLSRIRDQFSRNLEHWKYGRIHISCTMGHVNSHESEKKPKYRLFRLTVAVIVSFLCYLRSINIVAHKDQFVCYLSMCLSGSHTLLDIHTLVCFIGYACIPWIAAFLVSTVLSMLGCTLFQGVTRQAVHVHRSLPQGCLSLQ